MNLERTCHFCGSALDPLDGSTFQQVVGWERKAHTRSSGKKGGSDVYARERREEYAHMFCVERSRQGLSPLQESLI